MRIRGNVIIQYSAATLLIVTAISVALGITLTRRIAAYQIDSHVKLYEEVSRLTMKDDAEAYALFAADSPGAVSPHLEALFRDFLSLGNIFRVKIWGRDGAILWSDQAELIGQRFPDNDGFQEAMQGAVTSENAQLETAENIDEKDRGVTLEIYTPVFRSGTVVGVVELYEADRDLFAQIERNTIFTWSLVVVAGALLWLMLFAIFLRAYRRQKRTADELLETQDVTIFALAYQAELRDRQTGKHLERTAIYVRALAEELALLPSYRSYLSPAYISDLVKSAPLHDIGKVGIADSILLKPARLTEEETAEMRKHCEYGARVLRIAEDKLKFQSFLAIAIQLTLYHHEKWDGTGYPHGLKADAIPISGRIMALADNYDALRTARPYKEAMSHEQTRAAIVERRGTHFDPTLVDAFLRREAEFRHISEELKD
ncbi:MAG TPA: HD domain-containing phosphohydrolase [Spirochaetia bacterium]|nr:HD domain-containing phosphohydrolase [Spirochaetia bacterium]